MLDPQEQSSPMSSPDVEPEAPQAPQPGGFLSSLLAKPSWSTPPKDYAAPPRNLLGIDEQYAKLSQGGHGDGGAGVILASMRSLNRDQGFREAMQKCAELQTKLAEYEAAGDRLKASEALIEISKLERKLRNALYKRVALFSSNTR